MDLRLPLLPDLQPPNLQPPNLQLPNLLSPNLLPGPNLLSGSAAPINASVVSNASSPLQSVPPYLQKLLQLQQLQDSAVASAPGHSVSMPVHAGSGAQEQQATALSLTIAAAASLNIAAEISGAELAPLQLNFSSQAHHQSERFTAAASTSFLEVDDQ